MRREGLLDFNEAVQHPGKTLIFRINTALDQEADIDLLEPVSGTIEAVSTGNVLLVKADFKTKLVVECARCGSAINADIEFVMNDEFLVEGIPSSYASDGYAKVVQDEPEPLFKDNSLILDHFVRQGLLTNIPQQPLCSGSWEGECQSEVKLPEPLEEHGHPAFKTLETLLPGDSA